MKSTSFGEDPRPMSSALLVVLLATLLPGAGAVRTERFRIEFIQYGALVPVVHEVVRLHKAPFAVRVTLLKGQEGVVVSASFGRDYWDLGNSGQMNDVAPEPWETMAEDKFNSERTLLVDPQFVSFWSYQPDVYDWHRFDPDVQVKKRAVIGTHSVDTLFVVKGRTAIPVSCAPGPLYFVFLARIPFVEGHPWKELSRARVMVDWG